MLHETMSSVKPSNPFTTSTPLMLDPDPQRTATIDHWLDLINQTITPLRAYRAYLQQARTQSPDAICPMEFARIEDKAREAMEDLCYAMENIISDNLAVAVTGKPDAYPYILWGIKKGDDSPERWQMEIDSYRREYPDTASELQGIFDMHFGSESGALQGVYDMSVAACG